MSAFHTRRHPTLSLHAVFDGELRVSGWTHLADAERKLERKRAEAAGKFRKRKCLCCDEVFESEGPHHRLCNYHRSTIGGLGREMAG